MTTCPTLGKMLADLRLKMCAPTATRTRDLLLRRHFRNAAGRCQASRWGDMATPRSRSLIDRGRTPDASASSSCVSRASVRSLRSRPAKVAGGSATVPPHARRRRLHPDNTPEPQNSTSKSVGSSVGYSAWRSRGPAFSVSGNGTNPPGKRRRSKMADKPVWSKGEKATAVGLGAGILGGLTAAIMSLLNSEIEEENRQGNR